MLRTGLLLLALGFLLPRPSYGFWKWIDPCRRAFKLAPLKTDPSSFIPDFGGKEGENAHAMLGAYGALGEEVLHIVADAFQDADYERIPPSLRTGHDFVGLEEEWLDTNWARYLQSKGARVYLGVGPHRRILPWVEASPEFLSQQNLAVDRGFIANLFVPNATLASVSNQLLRPANERLRSQLRGLCVTGDAARDLIGEINFVTFPEGYDHREVPFPNPRKPRFFSQFFAWDFGDVLYARWPSPDGVAFLKQLLSDEFPNLEYFEIRADGERSTRMDRMSREMLRELVRRMEQRYDRLAP